VFVRGLEGGSVCGVIIDFVGHAALSTSLLRVGVVMAVVQAVMDP